MKIAYLCSDTDITVFGTEGCSVHIREVTEAFARAGHQVTLLCARLGTAPPVPLKGRYLEIQPEGLDQNAWQLVFQEPLVQDAKMERDLGSLMFNSRLPAAAAEIFAQENPDFIYERYALFGWAGIQLGRLFQIPVILEVNAPLCDEQEGFDQFTLVHTAREMETQILRSADAVVSVSSHLKDWMVSQGVEAEKIKVIPNGVSAQLFSSKASGEAVRAKHNLGGTRVIGYVGSFQTWHDISGLLAAFGALYQTDPNLRLLLVGEGYGKKALGARASEAGLGEVVHFTGFIPHETVPQYLAAMDVAVVPYSQLPNFYFSPLKLYECLAAGTPTIAADIGQIRGIVDHGETGWLYPPGDREALVEGMRALLYNAPLAQRIGQAARRKVLAEHTWDAVASNIMAMAEDLRRSRGQK